MQFLTFVRNRDVLRGELRSGPAGSEQHGAERPEVLAIVRRIIAEHGGSIEVGDNTPRGTRFSIELPS